MGLECAECERDLRGGHDESCSQFIEETDDMTKKVDSSVDSIIDKMDRDTLQEIITMCNDRIKKTWIDCDNDEMSVASRSNADSQLMTDEIERLRRELNDAYTEMSKLRGSLRAIYDRRVWQRVDKWREKTK